MRFMSEIEDTKVQDDACPDCCCERGLHRLEAAVRRHADQQEDRRNRVFFFLLFSFLGFVVLLPLLGVLLAILFGRVKAP